MIILSIDSGLEKIGYSIFQEKGLKIIYKKSGLIKTEKKYPIEKRIQQIYQKLNDVIINYKPNKIVIEKRLAQLARPKPCEGGP